MQGTLLVIVFLRRLSTEMLQPCKIRVPLLMRIRQEMSLMQSSGTKLSTQGCFLLLSLPAAFC